MPKIERKDQSIFAGNVAPTNVVAQFGSLADGSPNYSSDLDVIQALPAYGIGWGDAVINNSAPAIQDRNALDYVTTYQLAYLLEQGIAEYSSSQNYFVNSTAKDGATGVPYNSKTNDNSGNALTDDTNWEPMPVGGRGSIPLGAVVAVLDDYANVDVPASGLSDSAGYQLCDGAALSLDSTLGVGATLGSNTPDLTDGRFLRGTTVSGASGGAAEKLILETNLPSHNHSINHNHASFTTANGGSHNHDVKSQSLKGGVTSAEIVWTNTAASSDNYHVVGTDTSVPYTVGELGSVFSGSPKAFKIATISSSHSHSIDVPNYTGDSGSVGGDTAFNVEPSYLDVTYVIRVK